VAGELSIELNLTGISIHTAPIGVLERVALSSDEIREVYNKLLGHQDVSDALVLSTCNRTEVYTTTQSGNRLGSFVSDVLASVTGATRFPKDSHIYEKSGRDGVEHLFRVACGLDSLVLGETQILGQLKASWDSLKEFCSPTNYFEKLFQGAFRVAGHSRTNTGIGAGAVSVASAGVHLTTRIFSDLSESNVLVVGAGETGRLVTQHLMSHQPRSLTVVNRTLSAAESLAQPLGGQALGLEDLAKALCRADIVACAATVEEPLITCEMIQDAQQHRGRTSMAILDLGLPRNVDVRAGELANVFVQDIESLGRVVDANLSRRRKEIPQVEALIEEEITRLVSWRRSLRAAPVITALRAQVENFRQAEVARATKGLSDTEKQAVESATRAVTNKILHGPMTAIRDYATQAEQEAEALSVIKKLFVNLERPDPEEPES
jgi:glutamyl-tRNA reductase